MPFWMLGQDWHGVNTAPKNALPLKIVYQLQIFNSPPFANMVWPCLAMLPRTLFWICADTLVALLSASEEAGWSLYVFFGFFALSFSRSPQKDANKNSGRLQSNIEYSWTAPLLHLLVLYLSLFVIIFLAQAAVPQAPVSRVNGTLRIANTGLMWAEFVDTNGPTSLAIRV